MPPLPLLVGGLVFLAVALWPRKAAALPVNIKQALLSRMNALLGVPYLWGGKNPDKGLDCSGAVTTCVVDCGLAGPSFKDHNADQLYHLCKSIPESQVQAGDLAFYGSRFDVTHVMLCCGDGRVIGAAGGGPKTISVAIAKANGAEVKIEPPGYRKGDLVGYGRLPIV